MIAPVALLLRVKSFEPRINLPAVNVKVPGDANVLAACKVILPELLMLTLNGPEAEGNSPSLVVKPLVPL